jgi:hypothetical protein
MRFIAFSLPSPLSTPPLLVTRSDTAQRPSETDISFGEEGSHEIGAALLIGGLFVLVNQFKATFEQLQPKFPLGIWPRIPSPRQARK